MLLPLLALLPLVLPYEVPCPKGIDHYSRGRCYSSTAPGTWTSATDACGADAAGRLAAVHNAFDNAYLAKMVANTAWLGGKFDGSKIQWVDGSPDDYRRWKVTPTSSGCVSIDFSGYWAVEDCSTQLPSALCSSNPIVDCLDWRSHGETQSGPYPISVSTDSVSVFCEMETNGGGWTVLQSRVDATEPFWNRTWEEYKNGFGAVAKNSNFWLGNEVAHSLTNQGVSNDLMVEMWGDRMPNSNHSNDFWWGQYIDFSLDSESANYTLHVWLDWAHVAGNASSNWYDITFSSTRPFSTVDRINDPVRECVTDYHLSGWWLYNCAFCSLNGEYVPPISWGNGYGMWWLVEDPHWEKGEQYQYVINPKSSRMMFRRKTDSSVAKRVQIHV